MKNTGEIILKKEPFSEILMGNTVLVRAMIESGCRVVTAYPGSPTPEIATAIRSIELEKRPFYFEFSTNEKVATEIAYGASINGHLSTVFFKSVGLNVAADTFVQLNLMNLIGGMVVVLGDDPGANSSQNEQDNRHYAYLSYTPVFEPASPGEIYTFYKEAAAVSRKEHMPVILRLTTHVCHAKEKVSFSGWKPAPPDNTPRFDPANGPYIPLTPDVLGMKKRALERLAKIEAYSNGSPLNQLIDNHSKTRGVITWGLPFLSLMDVLGRASAKPDILKLAIPYPMPRKLVKDFLERHQEVKILEELDDEMEKEIKTLAYDEGITTKIVGKLDLDDWIGEYTPEKVYRLMEKTWPDLLPARAVREKDTPAVPIRPPQMCPGCGHRSAFHAVKKALADSDITVGDIGCHTMAYLPPYLMGQMMMCMGASTSIGAGLSMFNDSRKVVVFMGDSTFFHAALPGIVNALFNKHSVTMVLMENGTTAMTGHQDHPASGSNFSGPAPKIPVKQALEGLGVEHIFEAGAYQQEKLIKMVKEAVELNTFSVIIAKHPCMLKFDRERRRKPGYRPKRVRIDQGTCERINECVETFACPTFTRDADGRIEVNDDLCIGDGSCVQVCPVNAITPPETVEK